MLRRTFLVSAFSAAAVVVSRTKVNASSLGTLAWLQDGALCTRNLPDGAPIALASGAAIRDPAFSPSGRWIAFSDQTSLRLISIDGKRTKSWQRASGKWMPGRDELIVNYEADSAKIFGEGDDWGAPLRTIAGPIGAVSPDGNYYASASTGDSGGKLFVRLFGETGNPQPVAETAGYFEIYGFTRDGQRLLYWMAPTRSASATADGLELYSAGADGQDPVNTGIFSLVYQDFLALSPTADTLAATAGGRRESWTNKGIELADLSSGAESGDRRRLTEPAVSASHPAWSPDGNKLAWSQGPDADAIEKQQLLASGQKTIKVIDPKTGVPRDFPVTAKTNVGASDDLVQKCVRLRRIWTADIGEQTVSRIQLTNDARYSDQSPVWSSDGNRILFARIDAAGAKSMWLMRNDGNDLEKVADSLGGSAGSSASGFYGYTPWRSFFDWSHSL